MKTKIGALLIATFMIAGCNSKTTKEANQVEDSVLSIIFETDMGNDVDDALALDMLYKYVEAKKVNLLAISTNKKSEYSAGYIDIMNTWYGHPDIPIGVIAQGASETDNEPNFVRAGCDLQENGKPAFERTVKNHNDFQKSVPLYRKILASQPDSSVVIVSVGFSSNLAQLLETEGDEFSPLSGKELVAKKVKQLSTMMGRFVDDMAEFNVTCDIPSAQKLIEEWPTEIVLSPFEVGDKILYPASSIENDFKWKEPNPLVVGYINYLAMPYDRPTWDLTSVLYVVEKDQNFFNLSEHGIVAIDDKGVTRFTPSSDGRHSYLMVSEEQANLIRNYFIKLITLKPLKYQDTTIDNK